MKNYEQETQKRVAWIKNVIAESGSNGIIYGNSGGKDCALVGILSKLATPNVLSVKMPCSSTQNYGTDTAHADLLTTQFKIETTTIDLTQTRETLLQQLNRVKPVSDLAKSNIAPRLRMTTLYALGQTLGYLVAGTGNKSESYMGYFTKWGDGAHDFNPIADLTVTDVYAFLAHLNAPQAIIKKAPSAGLFEGQTDEADMGISYDAIDTLINTGHASEAEAAIITRAHTSTAHKRQLPKTYPHL